MKKTKSLIRRLFSFIAAIAMVVGMSAGSAIPAFADTNYGVGDDTTGYTLTINGTEADHTYTAYQIFAGDLATVNGKQVLSNIVPGNDLASDYNTRAKNGGEASSDSLAAALKADSTIGSKFSSLANNADAATIAKAIADANIADKSADSIALAKVLKNYITTGEGHGQTSTVSGTTYTISNLKAGYYMVQDSATGDNKNYSQLILEVIQSQTITPKSEKPDIDKKITGIKDPGADSAATDSILDKDANNKGTVGTVQVGSVVSYEVTGSVPSTAGYSAYTYTITDTLSDGLDFVANAGDTSNVVVKIGDVTDNPTTLTQDTDNDLVANEYTVSVSGKTLTITIPKVTLDAHQSDANKTITVTYDAKVNSSAATYNFEENKAQLEYSNNPEESTTSKTTEKKTYVVDVNIEVNKFTTDDVKAKSTYQTAGGEDDTTAAANAGYMKNPSASATDANYWVKTLANAKFKLFKGDSTPADDANSWYSYDASTGVTWTTKAAATELTTKADGTLTTQIAGLDAGTYGLLETVPPAGYNTLSTNPISITISATISGSGADNEGKVVITSSGNTVTNGVVDITAATGSRTNNQQPLVTTAIENKGGSTLPSTGGRGTTLFYLIGGCLVAAAVVVLALRRRKA